MNSALSAPGHRSTAGTLAIPRAKRGAAGIATGRRSHPNRPVMYASVRGSEGIVNICRVG